MATVKQGREGDDNKEGKTHQEQAKKAFKHLKSLFIAMGTRELSHMAQRLLWWANSMFMQWKEINTKVTNFMSKEI